MRRLRRLYCFLVGHDVRLIAYSQPDPVVHEQWACRRCPWSQVIHRSPLSPLGGGVDVGGLFGGRGELAMFTSLVVVFVVVLVRVAGWWQP